MSEILDKIRVLAEPLLEGTDMFITDIRIKPTNNIKFFLDADTGLSVEKSALVNRRLYALIEQEGLFPDGDFSLEVSSPGVDEPLRSMRQYRKNIGRTVLVTLEGEEVSGKLLDATEEHLRLEYRPKPKAEPVQRDIPMSAVKSSVVQIVF